MLIDLRDGNNDVQAKYNGVNKEIFHSFGLSRDISDAFWRIGKIQKFSNLDKLYCRGDKANFIGLVIDGKIAVLDIHGAVLSRIVQGDIFGELSFILGSSRTSNIVGVGEGSFLRIEFESLSTFFSNDPVLKSQWFQWLALKLAERLIMHVNDIRKYVALIAHDQKKDMLTEFSRRHHELLSQFDLVATATTARFLLENIGLDVSRSVSSGPIGGDMAIGSLITTGNIQAIIFFKDPLTSHPHRSDIEALSRLCDVHNIPLATNTASAELILKGLVKKASDSEWDRTPPQRTDHIIGL